MSVLSSMSPTVPLKVLSISMCLENQKALAKTVQGSEALHCMQGLHKTCMYCGDGINDLAAIAAADVGMAIASSDASAASTVTTKRCSIAGGCIILVWRVVSHCLTGGSCNISGGVYHLVQDSETVICPEQERSNL